MRTVPLFFAALNVAVLVSGLDGAWGGLQARVPSQYNGPLQWPTYKAGEAWKIERDHTTSKNPGWEVVSWVRSVSATGETFVAAAGVETLRGTIHQLGKLGFGHHYRHHRNTLG